MEGGVLFAGLGADLAGRGHEKEVEASPEEGRVWKMQLERTLVLVKPDGVQRGLVGEILQRLEKRGLRLAGLKMLRVTEELARQHYAQHEGKPFFPSLVRFITSGPVVAVAVEGPGAIQAVRTMLGATDPQAAAPGTLRGDLGLTIDFNLVHGSDSPAAAEREIRLFFSPEELHPGARADAAWVAPGWGDNG